MPGATFLDIGNWELDAESLMPGAARSVGGMLNGMDVECWTLDAGYRAPLGTGCCIMEAGSLNVMLH